MSKASKVVGVRVTKEQKQALDAFQRQMGFETQGEALRTLIERGLFITDTPKGPWREAAFRGALANYKMQIHAAVSQELLDTNKGINRLVERAIERVAKQEGFQFAD